MASFKKSAEYQAKEKAKKKNPKNPTDPPKTMCAQYD